MTNISLNEIQEYCKGKRIALVGNSDKLLQENFGIEIDQHDIIIRMNHAVSFVKSHSKHIGSRTDIYIPGINGKHLLLQLCNESNAKYFIIVSKWTKENDLKEKLLLKYFNNVYLTDYTYFKEFANSLGKFKPSTGLATFKLLVDKIEFKELNLYGFDFFKSSTPTPNIFRSFNYKDHSGDIEQDIFLQHINSNPNINLK